jgi:agmatine deiminase
MTKRFQLLPEWAEQASVLLAWPHQSTNWQPWLNAIEQDYVALACAIAQQVPPLILCQDDNHRDHVQRLLQGQCQHPPRLVVAPYNDTWCRDYGPLTTFDGRQHQLLDFYFNGWGDKYDAELDNQINTRLSDVWQAPLISVDFEMEGGSIETDGCGTLLTTHHCLLDSNRNLGLDKSTIEKRVLDQLGLDRALWLKSGALIGDDTDSHIDNLARFTDAHTIAYAACRDSTDPHFSHLAAMEKELQAFRQADGSPYKLQPIHIPSAQYNEAGKRLPGSYINFLIVNQIVIVPMFNCEEDVAAKQQLQACFPDKKIVSVPGQNLIKQFGGPHCATMQLPKGIINA